MNIYFFLLTIVPIPCFILFPNRITNFDKSVYLQKVNNFKNDFKNDFEIMREYNNTILNEIDFLLNKKNKVYIHLEQLIEYSNIYHVGITFNNLFYKIRFDIGTFDGYNIQILKNNIKVKTIFWDYTNRSLEEIIDYEKNMEYSYILGIYDCRHYVRNLTGWACTNPTPVWSLYKYF